MQLVARRHHPLACVKSSRYGCVLAAGGLSTTEPPPNPSSWLADKLWAEMVRLEEAFPTPFAGLSQHFSTNQDAYKVQCVDAVVGRSVGGAAGLILPYTGACGWLPACWAQMLVVGPTSLWDSHPVSTGLWQRCCQSTNSQKP